MRLSGFHLPVEHFSASSIAKAITCPEQYRRRYLLHERESFGLDKFIGTIDHETIAENFKAKMKLGHDWPEETLLSAHKALWYGGLEEETPVWNGADPDETFDLSKRMVSLYHQEVAPSVVPIAVEQRFEEKIPGCPVPVIGYIDVETEPSIVERKTAGSKLSKPKSGWVLQGRIYQLIKRKPVEWQITTKQKTPQVVHGLASLTLPGSNPDHTVLLINQIVERLDDLYMRYGKDQTWPTDGMLHDWACSYCQFGPKYQNDCVAWSIKKGA